MTPCLFGQCLLHIRHEPVLRERRGEARQFVVAVAEEDGGRKLRNLEIVPHFTIRTDNVHHCAFASKTFTQILCEGNGQFIAENVQFWQIVVGYDFRRFIDGLQSNPLDRSKFSIRPIRAPDLFQMQLHEKADTKNYYGIDIDSWIVNESHIPESPQRERFDVDTAAAPALSAYSTSEQSAINPPAITDVLNCKDANLIIFSETPGCIVVVARS